MLKPTKGNLTYDMEGNEGGKYHSRVFHVPSNSSGLTIGRGYDMKMRTEESIEDDLLNAGLDDYDAEVISQAAGLKGKKARDFIKNNNLKDFEITIEQQVNLFNIEYARQETDTKRLVTKADVVRAYGKTDWDNLNPTIREILVDLRFRGDFTPKSRRFLMDSVVDNDLRAFEIEIRDRDNWPTVPANRFNERKLLCE